MVKAHLLDYDLIVVGSGAAGHGAVVTAAQAGKKVALIESSAFGGDSPNWGDVPIAALLESAELYYKSRSIGAKLGLRSATVGYNYHSVRQWKDLAIKKTGAPSSPKYYESIGIDVFKGHARFISPNEISVNKQHISARYFVIATGSTWYAPGEIKGIAEAGFITPYDVVSSFKPPKTLLIIGGGDTGVAIAQFMSSFGSKVYLAEKATHLLPEYDSEAGVTIEHILDKQHGVVSLTHSRVISVQKDGFSKKVLLTRGGVDKHLRVDEILVTAGRIPNLDLGLENAGIKHDQNGIKVGATLRTNVSHIAAAGAVTGKSQRTHEALLEGETAASNLLLRTRTAPKHTASPKIALTNPNVAAAGLSETECIKQRIAIKKAVVSLSDIGRSNTANFSDGLVKIITNKKGVILGATIVSPNAAEMIGELALAIKQGLSAQDLAATPHAFLSWSEAIQLAAQKLS